MIIHVPILPYFFPAYLVCAVLPYHSLYLQQKQCGDYGKERLYIYRKAQFLQRIVSVERREKTHASPLFPWINVTDRVPVVSICAENMIKEQLIMAVFRVERTNDHTVTSSYHLRDRRARPSPSATPAEDLPMWEPCTTASPTPWSCRKRATTPCVSSGTAELCQSPRAVISRNTGASGCRSSVRQRQ